MDYQLYLSLGLSFIGVILILVAFYFFSRWLKGKYSFHSMTKRIRIMDHVMLGRDKSIVVADIYGSKYIIGISGSQLTLLKDLGDIELDESTENQPQDFNQVLLESFKHMKKRVKEIVFENGGKDEQETK